MRNRCKKDIVRFLSSFPFLLELAKRIVFYIRCGVSTPPTYSHSFAGLQSSYSWDSEASCKYCERFFGYYGKSPWNSNGNRFILHQHLHGKQTIEIIGFEEKSEKRILGTSSAWNYQQGSMLQWLPQSDDLIIFNDIVDGKLIARIVSWDQGCLDILPMPIQAVHPDGSKALTLNYRRLDKQRPEYGYGTSVSNFTPDQHLEEDGLWQMTFSPLNTRLIVTLEQLTHLSPRPEMVGAEHRINHVLYSPSGHKCIFMHRWKIDDNNFSRLYMLNLEDCNLRLLMDDDIVSHYTWQDEEHVLVFGRSAQAGDHYYLIDVREGAHQIIGADVLDRYGDGHPSYSPDGCWLLTDSYPDRKRMRHLLLYEIETGEIMELGQFYAPWHFERANRCDLHPRWNPNGKMVSIDSAHTGRRDTYILEISTLLR